MQQIGLTYNHQISIFEYDKRGSVGSGNDHSANKP